MAAAAAAAPVRRQLTASQAASPSDTGTTVSQPRSLYSPGAVQPSPGVYMPTLDFTTRGELQRQPPRFNKERAASAAAATQQPQQRYDILPAPLCPLRPTPTTPRHPTVEHTAREVHSVHDYCNALSSTFHTVYTGRPRCVGSGCPKGRGGQRPGWPSPGSGWGSAEARGFTFVKRWVDPSVVRRAAPGGGRLGSG